MLNEMVDDGAQVMSFNAAVYGLNAIKKAAYAFDDDFYIFIEPHERMTEVCLIPKECRKPPAALVGAFCNEVLDQELRERVTAEITGIHNLLFYWFRSSPRHLA